MSPREAVRTALQFHPAVIVNTAAILYFMHVLLQGKIALCEQFAFWSMFFLAWAIVRHEIPVSWHLLLYPLVLYALVSSVSALFAPRRLHAWGEGMLWYKILIFPAALILLRELPRLRRRIVWAWAIFAAGMAIWGLIQFFIFDRRDLDHRISGPSSHVMTFSGLLLPLSLMFLLFWWYERKPWQLFVTVVTMLALLLTFTRSVWIGWAAAMATILLSTGTRARRALYAIPLLILFVTFLPLPLFSRLVSTFDLKQSSNFDRIRMVQAGVEMIRDYPLLGVGPANVKEVYTLYRRQDAPRPRPPHLHNNVIQLWAERGILGLAAYVVLLGLFVRQCRAAWNGPRRMWAEAGLAMVVSLTVAGFFEFNFGDTEVFYLMLNLLAWVVSETEQPLPALNELPPPLVPTAASGT